MIFKRAATCAISVLAIIGFMGGMAGAAPRLLDYVTSWIGNSHSYAQKTWVQINIEDIHVSTAGVVYANTPWDEGGSEAGIYKDGRVLGHAGTTHGWGKSGGEAVAANDSYLFLAGGITSSGGRLVEEDAWPRKGRAWFGISRRTISNPTRGAPFLGARGNRNDPGGASFLLINEVDEGVDAGVRGLAADDRHLFVANEFNDTIEVYDPETLRLINRWRADRPTRIALDTNHNLWVIEHDRTSSIGPIIARYDRQGKKLTPNLEFEPDTVPIDLAVDATGRLLVADNGWRQQILVFDNIAAVPKLAGKIGEEGGIFSGRPGVPGPLRFNGITAVGADGAGNIYVAMNGLGPRQPGSRTVGHGTVLESYTADLRLRWQLLGLLFVDGADVDRGDDQTVYTGGKKFHLRYDQPDVQWTYVGFTANRFKYPEDPAFHLDMGWRGQPMVRRVDQRLLLYLTDMYSRNLKIYRFDSASDGEVAVPSGFITQKRLSELWPPNQPATGEWIWRDGNGNGKFDKHEFQASGQDAPETWGWWVDSRGDIWQAATTLGIRRIPFEGYDEIGNPKYQLSGIRVPMPAPFNRLTRVMYFPETDSMYLSGYTPNLPYDPKQWKEAGPVLARYDRWSTGNRAPTFLARLPWDTAANPKIVTMSFAVAGEFIFAVDTYSATVFVLEGGSGQIVGVMKPGPEVGRASGWIDVPMGMTAHKRSDGEYLIFVEEDLYGKVIMYRWRP